MAETHEVCAGVSGGRVRLVGWAEAGWWKPSFKGKQFGCFLWAVGSYGSVLSSGISRSGMVSVLVTLALRHCLLVCTSTEIKTHPCFPVFQSIHSLFSTLPEDSCQHSAWLTHDSHLLVTRATAKNNAPFGPSSAAAVPRNTPERPVTVHVWPEGL